MLHKPSFSLVSICLGIVAVLITTYIGLIAIVMSYAALTVEFSQSVRDGESEVATLEENYLAAVSEVMQTDYRAANYAVPVAKTFVRATSVTALR